MTKSVHVRIQGKVQGVWYRAWTEQTARQFDLSGWVRNCRDGTVEALFSGEEGKVDGMLAECWKGPEMALVTSVDTEECSPPKEAGFGVRPDA
ncbi:acylphosphatase [Aestuariispira ectoiniformans]|uniref:acylphosphatase n=1 Tax=Aestuariispira ectoiniformans TaxID=2775080 RepID=UPI00223AFA77|nr:acylphosphatase [Aestuariispira ectoiniformans]